MRQSFVLFVGFWGWQCRGMKPRTEEFLNFLFWSAGKLVRPTFSNITESYESWAYRNGLFRQAAILEQSHLIERDPGAMDDRIYRLTWRGRLHVLGGRDPQKCWSREWDGRWRLVLFDVPTSRNSERARLRRYLQARGFGWLQNSVWVTPNALEEERQLLRDGKVDVESLLLLEARPCAGESDAEIVSGAWDFNRINRRYVALMRLLDERPSGNLKDEVRARALQRWAAAEREAWLDAVAIDPLLPERLLPSDYLGRKAWDRRVDVLREAGRQLRTFSVGRQ
jgi:phenylacetic acid degradation operon negative regulatory protein